MDTFPFTSSDQLDNLESMTFKINTDNGFPLDVNIQIYFADSLYNKLDSLMSDNSNLLNSGVINPATGVVVSPTHTTSTITFNQARLPHLKYAKFLILKGTLNSTDKGAKPIRITSDNNLVVKLGIRTKLIMSKLTSN